MHNIHGFCHASMGNVMAWQNSYYMTFVMLYEFCHAAWVLPYNPLFDPWHAVHRMPKGPKMVFGGGRRQILSFLSQTNSIRPNLHHFQGIHLDKLQVQSKFKSTFTFFLIFCIFALFEPRFQYSMSIQPPFLTCQHICPSGIS